MRNPSAYVPNFLNSQICCILSKFKNFIFAKIFDFKFSHRRESTRRGGVANFTGVAAFGGGVHPCTCRSPVPYNTCNHTNMYSGSCITALDQSTSCYESRHGRYIIYRRFIQAKYPILNMSTLQTTNPSLLLADS